MRALALMLCLLSAQAWATTWYVRPVSAEYGAEDGTSYATAFDGYNDIVWGGGGVVAGDTLIFCGTFNDSTNMAVGGSGTAGLPITITGDCSSQGDLARAKLIAGSGGIVAFGSTGREYLYITKFEFVGGSGITQRIVNISAASDTSATAINVTLDDIVVHDTMGEGAASRSVDYQCLRLDGSNITVRNAVLYNCEGDGVYTEGNDQLLEDLTVSRVDLSGTPYGDCVQYGGGASSVEYRHNRDTIRRLDCDHTNKTTKHGVIFGCDTGAGTSTGLVLEDSIIRGASYNVAIQACDDVTIRRNYLVPASIGGTGTARGIGTLVSVSTTDGITAIGNVIDMQNVTPSAVALFIDQSAGFTLNAFHNTIWGNGDETNSFGIYVFNPTAGTVDIRNNLIAGMTNRPISVGASATGTASYNALWNNAQGCQTIACSNTVSSDPSLVRGSSPTSISDFCLGPGSSILAAGTYIGAWATGHEREDLGKPPAIGARGLCNARRAVTSRRAISGSRAP